MTPKYKNGDACETGQIIETILGQSTVAVVYTTKDRFMRWEYFENNGDLPDSHLPAVSCFDALLGDIVVSVPARYQSRAEEELGSALFAALDNADSSQHLQCFDTVKRYIKAVATQHARFVYVITGFGVALLLVLAGAGAYFIIGQRFPDLKLLLLAGVGGGLGALLSILFRADNLDLDSRAHAKYLAFQGASRVALGVLFGALFVAARRANLVAGAIPEAAEPMLVCSVVAGFSERFVPEIMRSIESLGSSKGEPVR